jgi:DNA-binding transcriptional ArsR family regulator
MARLPTTFDSFNAIADPTRRQIVDVLARRGSIAVGALVLTLGLSQPAVSKHLGVLRKVGLVAATKQGQQRVYRLNPEQLKPMYDWIKTYERFWTHQIDRIKQRAEQASHDQTSSTPTATQKENNDDRNTAT